MSLEAEKLLEELLGDVPEHQQVLIHPGTYLSYLSGIESDETAWKALSFNERRPIILSMQVRLRAGFEKDAPWEDLVAYFRSEEVRELPTFDQASTALFSVPKEEFSNIFKFINTARLAELYRKWMSSKDIDRPMGSHWILHFLWKYLVNRLKTHQMYSLDLDIPTVLLDHVKTTYLEVGQTGKHNLFWWYGFPPDTVPEHPKEILRRDELIATAQVDLCLIQRGIRTEARFLSTEVVNFAIDVAESSPLTREGDLAQSKRRLEQNIALLRRHIEMLSQAKYPIPEDQQTCINRFMVELERITVELKAINLLLLECPN